MIRLLRGEIKLFLYGAQCEEYIFFATNLIKLMRIHCYDQEH